MKICKKCSMEFKSYAWIDGKHYSFTNRSYCLDCSPLGEKKGYLLRKEKTHKKLECGDKKGKICPICNTHKKNYYKNNVCSTCRSSFQRLKTSLNLKYEFGGKCFYCQLDEVEILQFHHLDPKEKNFNLSVAYSRKSIDLLKKEASKCILLCPNCHAKEHLKNKQHIINYYKNQCGILDSNQ